MMKMLFFVRQLAVQHNVWKTKLVTMHQQYIHLSIQVVLFHMINNFL